LIRFGYTLAHAHREAHRRRRHRRRRRRRRRYLKPSHFFPRRGPFIPFRRRPLSDVETTRRKQSAGSNIVRHRALVINYGAAPAPRPSAGDRVDGRRERRGMSRMMSPLPSLCLSLPLSQKREKAAHSSVPLERGDRACRDSGGVRPEGGSKGEPPSRVLAGSSPLDYPASFSGVPPSQGVAYPRDDARDALLRSRNPRSVEAQKRARRFQEDSASPGLAAGGGGGGRYGRMVRAIRHTAESGGHIAGSDATLEISANNLYARTFAPVRRFCGRSVC